MKKNGEEEKSKGGLSWRVRIKEMEGVRVEI